MAMAFLESCAKMSGTDTTAAAAASTSSVPALTAEEVHKWLHPDDNIGLYGPPVTCGSCNVDYAVQSFNDGYDHHYWYAPVIERTVASTCSDCDTFFAAAIKKGYEQAHARQAQVEPEKKP
jgi:hypothetical protein